MQDWIIACLLLLAKAGVEDMLVCALYKSLGGWLWAWFRVSSCGLLHGNKLLAQNIWWLPVEVPIVVVAPSKHKTFFSLNFVVPSEAWTYHIIMIPCNFLLFFELCCSNFPFEIFYLTLYSFSSCLRSHTWWLCSFNCVIRGDLSL